VVIPRLATDLKNDLPEEKGFSERNIGYMIRFAREYGAPPILQQPVAKLDSTDLKQTSRSHKGWSTIWFPQLKGRG
jgi:hypothetical protein